MGNARLAIAIPYPTPPRPKLYRQKAAIGPAHHASVIASRPAPGIGAGGFLAQIAIFVLTNPEKHFNMQSVRVRKRGIPMPMDGDGIDRAFTQPRRFFRIPWAGWFRRPPRGAGYSLEGLLRKGLVLDRKTGCLLWGPGNRSVYGAVSIGAHRLAWEIANGPIPRGLQVLHRCDTPRCCNPDHLFLGTQFDNMVDMHRKGRWRNKYTGKLEAGSAAAPTRRREDPVDLQDGLGRRQGL
jgi:hypothetical protein